MTVFQKINQIVAISKTSGIVAIESIVDTETSLLTYAASQSYFSANIVAELAAGAEAIITVTRYTFSSIQPVRIKALHMNATANGKII